MSEELKTILEAVEATRKQKAEPDMLVEMLLTAVWLVEELLHSESESTREDASIVFRELAETSKLWAEAVIQRREWS